MTQLRCPALVKADLVSPFLVAQPRERLVAAAGQVRAAGLQQPGRADGVVLVLHRVGEREQVLLRGGVEAVLEEQCQDTRGRRGQECPAGAQA